MRKFLGFDPLLFLGIKNLSGEEKTLASKQLLNKISQYLLIRISEVLSIEDLKSTDDTDKLFVLAQSKILNFNDRIKTFLEDFKKEFYSNIKK